MDSSPARPLGARPKEFGKGRRKEKGVSGREVSGKSGPEEKEETQKPGREKDKKETREKGAMAQLRFDGDAEEGEDIVVEEEVEVEIEGDEGEGEEEDENSFDLEDEFADAEETFDKEDEGQEVEKSVEKRKRKKSKSPLEFLLKRRKFIAASTLTAAVTAAAYAHTASTKLTRVLTPGTVSSPKAVSKQSSRKTKTREVNPEHDRPVTRSKSGVAKKKKADCC